MCVPPRQNDPSPPSPPEQGAPRHRRGSPADADAVLAVCRLLVGISVRSLSAVQDEVGVVQLRILTVIASHGSVTLTELAASTGLHISLTEHGQRLVAEVAAARRAAIEPALRRMSAAARTNLVEALGQLTAAAGEPAETDLWALGWAT